MDPTLISLGALALAGAAATVSGCAEDLESDVGSQSNPNSQVQLGPQMGNIHRYFNKAISGEPVSYGLYVAVAGSVAWALINAGLNAVLALIIGSGVAAIVHGAYSVSAFLGRTVGQSQKFGQPVYMDVLTSHIGPIVGHGFIAVFTMVLAAYLAVTALGNPFPLPLVALIFGITVGAIGSSTGDVHYGAEREYQKYAFGGGIPVANQGDIDIYAEYGIRNGLDSSYFCSRLGGPLTGLCFGLIIFLDGWRSIVGNIIGGDLVTKTSIALVVGLLVVVAAMILNRKIEVFARNKYGPYRN
ncbi:tetrahydromethanopterin S-methyltransferase, subunit E [Methanococcus vannielii SB]|jgi:tetrahydromethanopterin S-methyltransferase subunit E|uniref:Tetrahydromethanopterin S-methyltransferase subunit E n=2 Tax=Methanococcus vannielii TaxID=2187 RepID=MTRE_METVS|nr:tetrahydromethanopterin S-methyltransferase subunit E [Methanococcus vannielii]A6UQK6.1 RecName: Full=Tetrahydromethanopterin S-methyltransferase subunit E; AltName: Full=N5-methyltetrahydromethanopterin--coenzyme M methyltransferase subunit E [Methanococcus vannielii SB]ABR54778.1 tetrahydromethanopterin S-methyltransferase, subunit E [Methanococcus vannielii SB]